MRAARETGAALALCLALGSGLAAQEPTGAADTTDVALSVEEALARALEVSEEVRLARAQLDAADAQVGVARSAMLPQFNTQIGFTKTLRSVFQNVGGGFELPDSLQFEPDSTASLAQRVAYLEENTPNAAFGALGSLFSDLPFGNENTWVAGLSIAQPLFTGGRISSAIDAAQAGEAAAAASLEEARSGLALAVKTAYYDAALAERSVEIVERSVELAQEHLDRVRLQLEAGRASELEALRADVELQNLRPQLVQARNARDLAVLNLKRLINVPAVSDVTLTTELDGVTDSGAPLAGIELPPAGEVEALLRRRAAVRAAEQQVEVRREQADIARSAYLPSLSLTGNLTRQAFPTGTFAFPSADEWRDDWTVGLVVQWPLFSGLRRFAEVDAAEAQVTQARLQLDQLREGVALEYRQARSELERAQAQIAAVTRTVEQAERVYELTELRFREGLATQLDVSDARLALQQARINQVQAFHAAYTALAEAERALGLPVDRTTLP